MHTFPARCCSYGATLLSVRTPDREGALAEVTLNRDSVDGLLNKNAYYGSTVGRVANRIAEARFALEDKVGRWGKGKKWVDGRWGGMC